MRDELSFHLKIDFELWVVFILRQITTRKWSIISFLDFSSGPRRAERHTFRSREFLHVLAEPDGEPCISWFMVRGRVVSRVTTTVSIKHRNLSHAGLVNKRVHISFLHWIFISIDSCQNEKPADQSLMTILDHGVAHDCAQRKYTGQLGSTCASLQFDMGDLLHGQLTAVKTKYPNITWPYWAGSNVGLTEVTCFFYKFTADQVMDSHWIAGSSIHKLLEQAKKSKLRC